MTDLPSSAFVVRGDDLRLRGDAKAILADAERIRQVAEQDRVASLEAARLEGLQQGIGEAADLAARASEAIEAFWARRDAELPDLVFAVAHRILSSLPADDLMLRLVRDAIAEHGRDVRLTLRVAPEAASLLRDALGDVEAKGRVAVIGDVTMAPGDCTLLHARGRTDIGLLAQFRAMIASLDKRVLDGGGER